MATLALDALLESLIDYAGLFPPAKLDMTTAVGRHAAYLTGPDAPKLGAFICPVSRLAEFAAALGHVADRPGEPWRVSALADGQPRLDLDTVARFNQDHGRRAVVDMLEIKAAGLESIDRALEMVPENIYPVFEIPYAGETDDPRGYAAALAGSDAAAKLRTGGVTADAFPAPERLAAAIMALAAADVPFKATAGLHHPIRAEHDLTYEPGCPRAVMHGFLNVFVGAALVHDDRADVTDLTAILAETDPRVFSFDDSAASWRRLSIPTDRLARSRHRFALSYGSCSFDEPLADLRSLGVL
ncbi:MAG: hypothetical protein JNM07_03955 [Phycisphaerae bacterium]|nr:hypothetical protein [Phycisphaerae bacterium]